MALSTSVNWISNFVVAFITPPLFSALQGGYYFLLLGFSAISGLFVWLVYRETSGKTLEQLGEVFGDRDIAVVVREPVSKEFNEGTGSEGPRIVSQTLTTSPDPISGSAILASSEETLLPQATEEIDLNDNDKQKKVND